MKKTLITGLLVVAVTLVGATIMTGRIFQGQVNNLTAEALKDPRLEVLDASVNEGMFSSSGNLAIAMQLEDGLRLIVESPWQASHLPLWVNFTGQTLVTLETPEEDEVINLLDELGMEPLEYQGRADWKKATYQMAAQTLMFNDGYASIEIPSMTLLGDYHYSGRQTGSLLAKQVTLIEKSYATTQLKLKDLALSWDQQASYPWVEGDAELKAEQVDFSSVQGKIQLIKPSLKQQLVYNQETFDYRLALDLGQVKNDTEGLGAGKLALKTESFNGQAVADLIAALAANPDLDQAKEQDLQAMMSAFDQLLSGSPALVLEEFHVNLESPFQLEQKATGKLSFDGNNLPLNYLLQLEEGRLTTDDPISRARLELNFSKLEPGLLMLVGIPLDLLDPDAEQQQLLFEANELKLNGQRIPF